MNMMDDRTTWGVSQAAPVTKPNEYDRNYCYPNYSRH